MNKLEEQIAIGLTRLGVDHFRLLGIKSREDNISSGDSISDFVLSIAAQMLTAPDMARETSDNRVLMVLGLYTLGGLLKVFGA